MKKRIISLLLLVVMALSLFTACGGDDKKVLSSQAVQQIVLDDMGISAEDVTEIHIHVGSGQDVASYNVYITVDGQSYEYRIAAVSGEILYSGPSAGGHSH